MYLTYTAQMNLKHLIESVYNEVVWRVLLYDWLE